MRICRRLEWRLDDPVPELLDGLGRNCAPLLEKIVLYHPRGSVREHTFTFFISDADVPGARVRAGKTACQSWTGWLLD